MGRSPRRLFSLVFDGEDVSNSGSSQHGVLTLTTVERLRELLSEVDLAEVPTPFQGEPPQLAPGLTLRIDLDTECQLALDVGNDKVALYTWNDGPHRELTDLDALLGTVAGRLTRCHTGDTITTIDPCIAYFTIE